MNAINRAICAAVTMSLLHWPTAGALAEDLGITRADAPAAASLAPEEGRLLLDMIVTWLASRFDLPASFAHPRLALAPPTKLAELRYGPDASHDIGDVVAVYSDDENTIYLGERWDGRTPAGLSVVVHEMVHHLQNVGGLRFACPGEREALAYRAQEEWLQMFGRSLAQEFQIDEATLMLRTTCAY
jgi:hypothetical protein